MLKKAPSEKRILKYVAYAILLVNRELEVTLCNDAVSQIWEQDKNKITGKTISSLFSESQKILNCLRLVFSEGKDYSINDFPLKLSPNIEKVVNVSMNPVFKKSHRKVQQVIVTIRDLTDHYQIKSKEQEKEILDSLGMFVSSIAHEIQNPLSGIKGATQLLQRELEKSDMPTTSTSMILHELGRIDRLVKELLLLSQPIPLDYSTFNLYELLNTITWFEENTVDPSITFHKYYDPSLPDITADKDKLHQVILNLIKNAVDASPKNGKIIIRSNYCPQWKIVDKQLDTQQKYYLIEVEDQGPGIPSADQKRLFKPLFTTKRKGNGLGLSISFRIIEEHGGLLRYKNAAEQGAIFEIYIPRIPPQKS
ncbi:MAG: PAS domain-containing protein [SAR324 cluster bacterium]|nr:PAS domain-containing protein [SAR324 cluster bacterium]